MMTTTEPSTFVAARNGSEVEHVDVLVVGAGVSGIGAAHHLQEQFPDRSFVILDAQDNRGGTWWTHQYPGVRSDSDLFTYGYRFKPWRGPSVAAGGGGPPHLARGNKGDGPPGDIPPPPPGTPAPRGSPGTPG